MEEMPKTYDPQETEPKILAKWLDGGYYRRSPERRPGAGDCTIVIPPPNVTGKLHMGHALDDSIQDAIVRCARMRGKSTRWIFGTDHAGIATQTKVDKKLKAEGVSRLELGREKFIDACWDWTHEYGGIIQQQIRRMGDLSQIAGMLPGGLGKQLSGASIDEKQMAHTEAIILSMTPQERENPQILNASRKKRIAAGCGLQVVDVNRLLKQFEMMQQLTKQMNKMGCRPGMPGLGGRMHGLGRKKRLK